jgi:hypothetical protein
METFGNEIKPFLSFKYYCSKCHYGTCKKSNYESHLDSLKHSKETFGNKNQPLLSQNKHPCEYCNKSYHARSGLWKHKKKCITNISLIITETTNKDELKQKTEELINFLMKENSEFKQLIIDQNKQMFELAKNSGNNNNNNSHNTNNSFNLQFFLNETCKDALNIMDFVSQLQVSIKDLEETGRLGFVEGISKIFINGLNNLDISNRPVHCSDSKREVLYIKDNDQWNKESEDKVVLTNALKHVVSKNMKLIPEWRDQHPKCNDSDSKENDRYLKIVMEAMPGSTKEESTNNYCKIIKNIAKETTIPKCSSTVSPV